MHKGRLIVRWNPMCNLQRPKGQRPAWHSERPPHSNSLWFILIWCIDPIVHALPGAWRQAGFVIARLMRRKRKGSGDMPDRQRCAAS